MGQRVFVQSFRQWMFRAAYGVGPTPGWDDIEGAVSNLACDGQRRRFPLNTRQWWKRQGRHRNPAPCGGLPGELIKWAAWGRVYSEPYGSWGL